LNDNILNKLVSGVIVGALLGLGSLFHWHLSDIAREVREAKAILRSEIRDTRQDIKDLETRVRKVEVLSRK